VKKKYAQSGKTRPQAGRQGNVSISEDIIMEQKVMRYIQFWAEKRKMQGNKYICHLLDFFETPTHYWTVLEDCDEGELFQLLEKRGKPFDDTTMKIIFHQLTLALKTIHDTGVSHRDISAENVFLTRIPPDERDRNGGLELIAKLGDFGLAQPMSPGGSVNRQTVGKVSYMAPEVFEGKNCDGRLIDIWSLGVILLVCLTCSNGFSEPSSHCPIYSFTMAHGVEALFHKWKISADPAAIDLLNSILCPAERRINIDQILAHRWLSTSPLSTGLR